MNKSIVALKQIYVIKQILNPTTLIHPEPPRILQEWIAKHGYFIVAHLHRALLLKAFKRKRLKPEIQFD